MTVDTLIGYAIVLMYWSVGMGVAYALFAIPAALYRLAAAMEKKKAEDSQ